jgi:hypothetical protein
VDWVDAIGYQHEPLHAGAISILLALPDRRDTIATQLFGTPVSAVSDPKREQRIGPNKRRPIDVLMQAADSVGGGRRLGIEIKVDSAWSPRQLEETVDPTDSGLLLALGCTALAVTKEELPPNWRLLGPQEWAELLSIHGSDVAELDDYRRHVQEEATAHAEALRLVEDGQQAIGARVGVALDHWAYFHWVRHHAVAPARWERKTLISGPLLTLWLDNARGRYIELMAIGEHRELCVKCWREDTPIIQMQQEAAEQLDDLPFLENARRPRPPASSAKSCTALALSLAHILPRDSAQICDELAAALRR